MVNPRDVAIIARAAEEGINRNYAELFMSMARTMGYDEQWMMQQLDRGRREVLNAIRQESEHGLQAARDYIEQSWHDLTNREQGTVTTGQTYSNSEVVRRHCDNPHTREQAPEACPQSNLPGEEQMAKRAKTNEHGDEHYEDIAQQGLDSINAEGEVWTHFPNSQKSRLRWRATVFQEDVTNWVSGKHPFGRLSTSTTTTLNATGGGAVTEGTTEQLASDTSTNGYEFGQPYLIQLRMTSPYNILKSIGGYNAATKSEPNWIQLFDSKYQYYQVQETDWGVTLSFGTPRTSGGAAYSGFENHKLKIFYRYTNQDEPPTWWTYNTNRQALLAAWTDNTTNTGTGQITQDSAATGGVTVANTAYALTSDDYERMGGWKTKTVNWNTTHSTQVHLGGKYKFGQCKMDIKTLMPTDAKGAQATPTAEGMTLSQATPVFPEILSIIIVEDYAACQAVGVTVPFSMQFDTSQLVDWCDLRANFKFPTPNCCTYAAAGDLNEEQFFIRAANVT